MRRNSNGFLAITMGMLLGCGGGVVQEKGLTSSSALPGSVILASQAETASPPSGKARITHLARGQNAYLGHLWIAPGAGVPLHRDPTEEYLYILEGGGVLTMNGEKYILAKGAAVFMPAGAEVSYANGDAPTIVLQVFAGPSSADKYQKWSTPAVSIPTK